MIHELVCFVGNTHYWYDSGANTSRAKELLDKFRFEGEPKQAGAENRLASFLLWLEGKHEFKEITARTGRGHDCLGIPIEFSLEKKSQDATHSSVYSMSFEEADEDL